ncbi:SDR family oxidoreductase [Janibacter sp. GXQ6167]|uniref:SDR family oxidoreductase n=1 Tax=Janibacter sp. GXQ6167 TaxID=3240791 RepID=UPI003523A032
MNVTHQVAIVTGAAGGIGLAVAERLLEEGASVLITDLDRARLEGEAERLAGEYRGRILAVAGDASNEVDLQRCIRAAERDFGPVDLFVANAGIGGGAGLDATDEQWQRTIEINVMAHVRAARLLVPGWVERGRGYFVTTASAAGLLTQVGSATYAVTKHGAVAFAEWLAVTYGAKGVGVSCLCPMGVDTPLLREGSVPGSEAELPTRAVAAAGAVLTAQQVADSVIAGIAAEDFLILPHPEVLEYFRGKGADYDRWIAGMQRFAAALEAAPMS